MTVRNDLPKRVLRFAAAQTRQTARAGLEAHGGLLVYAENGRLVGESADGTRADLGVTTATQVVLPRRRWKLG